MLPGRSARAGGSDAGHASTALRRPPSEKVPFSPLRRQYGGVPAGRQSVGGRARSLKWTDSDGLARQPRGFVTAGGGTRTHTDLRPGAFEAPSSTIPTLRPGASISEYAPLGTYWKCFRLKTRIPTIATW